LIYAGDLLAKKEVLKVEKTEMSAVEQIHALFRGELNPQNIKTQTSSSSVPERLRDMKEVMGDRLVIASVPKYNSEHQSKGFKL
jgi:hypothetical protein